MEECKLGSFQDASFACGFRDSKSTSGDVLYVLRSHKFLPDSLLFSRQTAVSHSSVESEFLSLGEDVLVDVLAVVQIWKYVLETLSSESNKRILERHQRERFMPLIHILILLSLCQLIMCPSTFTTALIPLNYLFEDNSAVIQMIHKGWSPNLRHVTRTHRDDVDTVLQTMTQKMTYAECIYKVRIQYVPEWLKSECILCDSLSFDQLRNHDFEDT